MTYLADVPKYGFGTAFTIGNDEGSMAAEDFKTFIVKAVELGCRHFDCAPLYGTQRLVGEALKTQTTVARSELFITSKLPVNMMREEHIERSIKSTLAEMQLNYLDLFLIHAPFATKYVTDNEIYPCDGEGNLLLEEQDDLLEQCWEKMVELKERGFVKFIGLSNINIRQLDRMMKIHQVDVVQMEYHIFNQDRELFDYCEELDVHFEAYAAFGSPFRAKQMNKPSFMTDALIGQVANDYNISRAQVVMQWLHHQPLSYVIRTDNVAQLEENLKASRKRILSTNDLIELDRMNLNVRLYTFGDYKGILRHTEYPFRNPGRIRRSPLPLTEHREKSMADREISSQEPQLRQNDIGQEVSSNN